jgi:ribosomal protein L11 methyltransferase
VPVKWVELSVEVRPEAIDAVSEVFSRHGTGGVAIEQPVGEHIEGEQPPAFIGLPIIKAYLPADARAADSERRIEEGLWHLKAFNLSPVGDLQRREIDEEDWANAWKEHFHPLQIGRIVVKPTWRDWRAQPGQIIVELDPGMAFGTGLHPTTRLMLLALQERVHERMRVFDLGTGSGILAIAAALMGATVVAVDSSSVAANVAEANIHANHLTGRISVAEGSIELVAHETFDLVLANLVAQVLIELAPKIASCLAPGAEVLGSGIIEERVDDVARAFVASGLEIVEKLNDEDWWLIVARRPA